MSLEFIQSPVVNRERELFSSMSSDNARNAPSVVKAATGSFTNGKSAANGGINAAETNVRDFEVDAGASGLLDQPYIGFMNWYSIKHHNYKFKYQYSGDGILDSRRLKFAIQQLEEYCPLLG